MNYELGRSITKLFKRGEWWIDKSLAEGRLVKLQGNTFQICRSKDTPYGVYTAGSFRRIQPLDGEKIAITIPEGVITYGDVSVRSMDKSDGKRKDTQGRENNAPNTWIRQRQDFATALRSLCRRYYNVD